MPDIKVASAITENTVITGAEFRDFYLNHWPGKDWNLDHSNIDFEDEMTGEWTLADDAKVKLGDLGYLGWQGDSRDPRNGKIFPLVDFYREYAKRRVTSLMTIEVPNERLAEVRAALDALGVKVLVASGAAAEPPCGDAPTAGPKP